MALIINGGGAMIYYSKETELTAEALTKIIEYFKLNKLPTLQKWDNYYNGKHEILNKTYSDASKECNHIVTNYCKIVTDTYAGYICGKPITYTSNNDIEDVQEVINYNDSAAEDMKWVRNALIFGIGYELKWIDNFA
jgi:SPP1 family phage portal protein